MPIGVSSYSFSQQTNSGQKKPLELIALAKEMGFDGIEYLDIGTWDGYSPTENAERLREESERVGLPIMHYTVGADFLKSDSVEKEAERLFTHVEIAKILGAPGLRHDATGGWSADQRGYCGWNEALPFLTKGCRMVTEYAAEQGIFTSVENHGFFAQDSTRVASLVGAVGHPNFGTLVDIGNFCCADEDPAKAVGLVAPFAKHAHIKDFIIKPGFAANPGEGFFMSRAGNYLRGTIVGHGNVPILQCVSILKRAHYTGWYSIEFEGMEDCLTALRIGLKNLRNDLEA